MAASTGVTKRCVISGRRLLTVPPARVGEAIPAATGRGGEAQVKLGAGERSWLHEQLLDLIAAIRSLDLAVVDRAEANVPSSFGRHGFACADRTGWLAAVHTESLLR